MIVVEGVGLFDGEARAGVLDDPGALFDGLGGVTALGVNPGSANDEMRWAGGFLTGIAVELPGSASRHGKQVGGIEKDSIARRVKRRQARWRA
jgi:hypothetical protein